ncbi:MAG: hypothetical protein JST00_17205 [Deltaproteobacteria bacterium]|nr:hypothetical protein [Deltaproteobacteria bacterium]
MKRRLSLLRPRADWIAVLDAVYASTDDHGRWGRDLVDTFRRVFTCGDGIGLMVVEVDEDCRSVRLAQHLPPSASIAGDEEVAALGTFPLPVQRAFFFPPTMVTSHSELEQGFDGPSVEMLSAWRRRWGLEDALGVVTHPEPGVSAILYAALDRRTSLERDERRRLTQLGLHFENAVRLRRNPRIARGVLELGGGVRLEDSARGDARVLLEEMKKVEMAHVGRRRVEAADALELWRALVAGRYSLVPRTIGGRREYLVLENAPRAQKIRALTPREVEVLSSAARGVPGKLVAYGLGLSEPAISSALRSCATKLGVANRMELLRIAAMLSQDPRMQASDETLTAAEAEVLQLLRDGLSNEQIARLRMRSVRTIANQVASLLRKTRSPSRRALLATSPTTS